MAVAFLARFPLRRTPLKSGASIGLGNDGEPCSLVSLAAPESRSPLSFLVRTSHSISPVR